MAKRKRTVGQIICATIANIGRFIAVLIMIGIITGCIVASVLTVYILRYMNAEDPLSIDHLDMRYTTILYAYNENDELYELQRLQTKENRIWVDYANIPEHMRKALIAVEDKRFLEHDGVDWQRTAGSFVNMFIPIYPGNAGGSTIHQQLIKNLTGDDAYRVDRKIREIFRAINLNKNYTKEQVMEAYLNTVYYSNNCYGVQAAANVYFGMDVKDLSLAQSASIIGITQFPGKYDPFVHPEYNKDRQEHILFEMLDQGMITQSEYDEAVKEKLVFKKEEAYSHISPVYSYFEDHVITQVIEKLETEKGYTYEKAQELVNSGGLRIITTVDERIQNITEEYYSTSDNFPKILNEDYPQSAAVVLDPNGAIKGIVGAIGKKPGMRDYSRATMSRRQPGSSIKPLAAYLQGIENDVITYSSIWDDNPITMPDGSLWPSNFQRKYAGPMTIEHAIMQSRNTIPVKIVNMLGPQRFFDFLHDKLNFYSLVKSETDASGNILSDINLSSMALGGMTHGITPLEMAGGYQIFANGGYFTEPYAYTEVRDYDDNVILKWDTTPRRVITPETATIVNKLMQRVVQGGTGTPARFTNNPSVAAMPIAGKTGTSTDDFDQWFIGCTPYYIGAVWLGYDQNKTIRYGSVYPPPPVFSQLMGKIHEDLKLEVKDFPIWGEVQQQTFCAKSGEAAIAGCPVGGTGWYKVSNMPPSCTYHSGLSDTKELSDDDLRDDDEEFTDDPDMSDESERRRITRDDILSDILSGRSTNGTRTSNSGD